MNWIARFKQWFRLVLDPSRIYRHEFVEDMPERPVPWVVYLVTDPGYAPWSAGFKCPCNCGETIILSLIPKDDPSWKASITREGKISLSPSVWRVKGCKSHFFIRESRVLWAKDDVRETRRPKSSDAKR